MGYNMIRGCLLEIFLTFGQLPYSIHDLVMMMMMMMMMMSDSFQMPMLMGSWELYSKPSPDQTLG